jgi:hypothetical protein
MKIQPYNPSECFVFHSLIDRKNRMNEKPNCTEIDRRNSWMNEPLLSVYQRDEMTRCMVMKTSMYIIRGGASLKAGFSMGAMQGHTL